MIKDKRVTDLYRLVDSGQYQLLSLDIFDTTVWRMVPNPVDVFFLLGRDLKKNGWIRNSSSIASFARERVRSEERSRKKKEYCTEVTLEEIYSEFPKGYLCEVSPSDVADLEFQKECELVKVYPEMAKLLTYAKKNGLKTAFVSDTYFNREQISTLVGLKVDYTILSSEYSVSKYYGLHGVLLEQSGIPHSKVLHVGDNYQADIEGPEIYPIDTYWFKKFPESFNQIIDLETPSVYSEKSQIIKCHDNGLSWHRSLAASMCESDYEKWGALVLGPLLSGFTDWIIDRCKKEKINSVLCLMREGRILKKTIDVCETSLETTELYISRYAALKAAIFYGSPEELEAFVFRPSGTKARLILSQLGLDENDVKLDANTTLSPSDVLDLIKTISASPMLKKKVVKSSKLARNNLIKHISNILDIAENKTVALVDLGYKGTIQENLQKIFNHENIPIKTHGLYFVTGGNVYQTQSIGATVEGWIAENGQPLSMAHTFMRSPELVEQSLMSDCGTTLGHDVNGDPQLDSFIIPNQQRIQIKDIQKGMIKFRDLWVKHKNRYGYEYAPKMKSTYQNICIRAVTRPLKIELQLFGEWEHDENFGSDKSRKLIQTKLNDWQLSHISPHQLASLSSSEVYWPFGLAYKIGQNMGDAVANIYLRKVKPNIFDSCEEQPMVFYWDSGLGFNRRESEVSTFRLNNRNRIWKRFELKLHNSINKAVGFSVGKFGEVLRLAGIKITTKPLNGEDKIIEFSPDKIEMMGYQKIEQNFYTVLEDPPLFFVPMKDVEKFTGTIRTDLFFSIMTAQGKRI